MINKFSVKSIIPFIFILIFSVSFVIFHNNIYCIDDLAFNFLDAPLDIINKKFWYGTWIMRFQYVLMYLIPFHFGIDFQTWGQYFGAAFKALIMCLMSFIYYKIFLFRKISDLASSILALIFFCFLFVFLSKAHYVDFLLFSGFFRFLFPAFLLYVCLLDFYKLFNGYQVNYFNLFLISLVTAYSSEAIGGILLTFSALFLIYKIFSDKSKKNILSTAFIFSGGLIGISILLFTPGFQSHMSDKLHGEDIVLSLVFKQIPEFISLYFKTMIIDYWYIWTLIIILMYLNSLKSEGRQNIFVSFVLSGVFAFAFSLLLIGKTHYSGEFWLIHNDLHSIFITVIMFCVVLLFSNFFAKYNNCGFMKPFIILLLISSVISFSFCAEKLYDKFYILKDFEYLREKMTLFYSIKHEIPKIPVTANLFNPILPELYKIDYESINDVNLSYLDPDYEDRTCGVNNMTEFYYPLAFGVQVPLVSRDIVYLRHNDALALFKQKGGSYDEVYSRTYKFSDLKNFKFILNIK